MHGVKNSNNMDAIRTEELPKIARLIVERKQQANDLFNRGVLQSHEMRDYIIGKHPKNRLQSTTSEKLDAMIDRIPDTALKFFSNAENVRSQRSINAGKIHLTNK